MLLYIAPYSPVLLCIAPCSPVLLYIAPCSPVFLYIAPYSCVLCFTCEGTKVKVHVTRDSCRTVTIHWSSMKDPKVDITLTDITKTRFQGKRRTQTTLTYRQVAADREFCFPMELTRGRAYKVVVRGVTSLEVNSGAQGVTTFRAGIVMLYIY